MKNMIRMAVISLFFFGCETGGQFDQYHLECPGDEVVEIDVSSRPIIEIYKDGEPIEDYFNQALNTDIDDETFIFSCDNTTPGDSSVLSFDFTVYYPN